MLLLYTTVLYNSVVCFLCQVRLLFALWGGQQFLSLRLLILYVYIQDGLIAIVANKEIMAAIKRKMSIIILLKSEHLFLSLLYLSYIGPVYL